jgi:GNAT superfamily N-acetyltransferase
MVAIMREGHPLFSIRDAAHTDAGSIAALISQLGYPTLESEMTVRLARLHSDSNYRTFVAEIGTNVVGVAGVGLAPYYERNGIYGRILVLAVDDKWRGNGIGGALVNVAEEWAASQGATAILVNSAHHRNDAHEFYVYSIYGFGLSDIKGTLTT